MLGDGNFRGKMAEVSVIVFGQRMAARFSTDLLWYLAALQRESLLFLIPVSRRSGRVPALSPSSSDYSKAAAGMSSTFLRNPVAVDIQSPLSEMEVGTI